MILLLKKNFLENTKKFQKIALYEGPSENFFNLKIHRKNTTLYT